MKRAKAGDPAVLQHRLLTGLIVCVLVMTAMLILGGVAVCGLNWYGEEVDRLASDNDALINQINSANRELQDTQSREDSARKEIGDLQSRLEQLEGRLNDAQSEIGRLESALAAQKTAPSASFPKDAKLVALTFDDGPGATTSRLLDELKKRGIRATFFVVGTNAAKHPDLLKRMAAEGHVVGSHSYAHKNLTKLTYAQISEDMEKTAEIIRSATGTVPVLMRPPGGNCNSTLQEYAQKNNYRIINWSVDTRDWESRNKEKVLATAFQKGIYGIQDGAVVLMHDIYSSTVDAAVEMMDRLVKDGYTLVTVPELLGARAGGGSPGTVYKGVIKG